MCMNYKYKPDRKDKLKKRFSLCFSLDEVKGMDINMKTLKNYTNFFFIIALAAIFSASPIFAISDADVNNSENVDTYKLLNDNGLPNSVIEEMNKSTVTQLENALKNNPEDVEIETTVSYFDNLKAIESIISHSDSELVRMGLPEEVIDKQKEQIMDMYTTKPTELMREYDLSKTESKLFYDAVNEGLKKKKGTTQIKTHKKIENINASGTISTTKLSTSTTKTSSPTKKYKVRYICNSTISWKSPFFTYGWDDKFAVAWGGDLNVVGRSGTAHYWTIKNAKYNEFLKNRSVSSAQTPGKGVIFTLSQGSSAQDKLKGATMDYTIRQTKKEGKETSMVWQYAHRAVKVGELSVSVKSASISIGTAYDKSKQGQFSVLKY